jgi:hypothetical protein
VSSLGDGTKSRIEAVTGHKPDIRDMESAYGQRGTSKATKGTMKGFIPPKNDATIYVHALPDRSHAHLMVRDPQIMT